MQFESYPANRYMTFLTPQRTFAGVAFFIGELGDGLNYFQSMYLVGLGWNEGAIGTALSLMGFTTLFMQTCAGDIVDRAPIDRRILLAVAALITAGSAMAIMFVREGNQDHMLMYITKILEGIACSFMMPSLTALTLANFGPELFDSIMASNVFWGLVGYAISATLVGATAYIFYPNIKLCFLVIGLSAVAASALTGLLPEGHPKLGSGFRVDDVRDHDVETSGNPKGKDENTTLFPKKDFQAASYWSVLTERRTLVFCLTGFFFHFANANVLLVLGELMSQNNDGEDEGEAKRNAIPLMAAATLISQFFMCSSVSIGDYYTKQGVGRKILFLAGIITLPLRCALVILWRNSGPKMLLLTQIFDGIEGGLFRVIHPYIVVDLTFGTGRFNIVMGLTNSFFWLGRTFSTLLGQIAVERYGHAASLFGSLTISCIPIAIFSLLMPETNNSRKVKEEDVDKPPLSGLEVDGQKGGSIEYTKMT